jgi:hypothetical protein
MLNKVKLMLKLLKGDCIVLTINGPTLRVDAGSHSVDTVKDAATKFFTTAYRLQ